ncbi:MAG: hypothetical protein ACFFFT_05455 [Candidatus Thorarchaeota archaeon]
MIGLDRPLKPEWIYELLQMIKIGDDPSEYNAPFELIAKELVGKEGKRKVRTVIFRSFVYAFQPKRVKIQNNIFLEWSSQNSLDYMRPIYLSKIIMDYEITRFIINKMDLSVDKSGYLSSRILTRKMVQEFGDRDVVKRSVRSFLKTLVHFNLLKQHGVQDYQILEKFELNADQIRDFLFLYAESFLKSKMIDLSRINTSIIYFYNKIDFMQIARKYHGKDWEYIRETSRSQLLLK